MVVLPIILWWFLYYLFKGIRNNINRNRWFTASLVALLTSIVTIPLIFYFYREAFGVELLVIDISILFISILLGQFLGLHFYKHFKGISIYVSIGLCLLILSLFIIFTFNPPRVPLFRDAPTGTYGIRRE